MSALAQRTVRAVAPGSSLRNRLIIAFLVVFALLGGVIVLGLVAVIGLHQDVDTIVERRVPMVRALEQLRFAGVRMVSSTSEFIVLHQAAGDDPGGAGGAQERERELLTVGRETYERAMQRYEALAADPAALAPVEVSRLRAVGRALMDASDAMLGSVSGGVSGRGLLDAKERFERAEDDYLGVVDASLVDEARILAEAAGQLHSGVAQGLVTIALAGLVALLLSALVAVRIARRVAVPVEGLASAVASAAAPGESAHEVGALSRAVRRIARELRSTTVSRDFLTAIVTSMNDSLVVLDTDSNVVMVNESTCRMLGYRADELRGQPSTCLLRDDSLRAAESTAELELLALLNGTRETHYQASDGRLIPVSVTGSVLRSAGGRRLGGILVAQDISERKRTQAELLDAKERAEAATRAKSQFLATMSHEIRTPMNGVLGMTDLLLAEALGQRQRGYVETVRRSGAALLTIINDILDFSKIEAGRLDLAHAPYDLVETMEDVATLIAGAAHEKDVELTVVFDADLPRTLLGDGERVRQVLMNLVGNAVKFTERGEVTVRAAAGAARDGTGVVRITVHDTGIGVPREALANLFKPFSQVDGGTARRFGGTGLGLAISRHLLELMGGRISVRSEAGRGSTFAITLPLEKGDAPAVVDRGACAGSRRVLVVSAHGPTRESLAQHLTRLGHRFEILDSGAAALQRLQEVGPAAWPDCIVLGRSLGDMDAVGLARALSRQGLAPGARRVALCRFAEEGTMAGAWAAAGIGGHLTLPVRLPALRDAVDGTQGAPGDGDAPAGERSVPRLDARVLLVEDHVVNREVVVRMLEQLGCEVAIANDGKAALQRLGRERFDLVLMDCDLPLLDGFETTRRLREDETRRGDRRLPVVALTANALSGDRERCLAAGMDDYLSKPMTREQLGAVIEAWVGRAGVDAGAPGPGSEPAIDPDVVAPIRAAGPGLLAELASRYAESWDEDVAVLRAALDAGDPPAVRRSAHRLKSASAVLGARAVCAICSSIEEAADTMALDRVPILVTRLQREYARVRSALEALDPVPGQESDVGPRAAQPSAGAGDRPCPDGRRGPQRG